MKNVIKKTGTWSAFPSFMLFVIFLVLYAVFSGGISKSFIFSFISTNAGAICVAIGVTATILIGSTDISLGSIVSVVNVTIVTLSGHGVPVGWAAVIALLVAVVCGMFNGFVVGVLRVTPLLTTYATSIAYAGIALWILPNPGGSTPRAFGKWYTYKTLGFIPTPVFLIALLLIIWFVFMKTPLKSKLYALGKDEKKAYASGINVSALKFGMHTFAGLAAGIAGICLTANTCAGSPTIGDTMSMNSIAASVIGGVSLMGGIGSIFGGVFGAMFLSILSSIVVIFNFSSYVQSFVTGLILLIGVVFSVALGNSELKAMVGRVLKRGGMKR